ncbi:hypothetical protein CAPTEDRAFT_228582 [Capitella teleta]|uniref:Uncharacterized protein n=1 Tax=Capitella teleta TaxID=283909 RepID=R7V966_CAPTE|nr:hypothetical protein CAPTEDRAFT_228582 [Capitella teleta]|eukprot:ELU15109.1 hypothetical protein CAPTEDRAFT_228582 [Capitella teleta]
MSNSHRRLSVAANYDWYHLLDDLYSRSDVSTFDPDKYSATNVSIKEIFGKTAHRLEDMLVRCEWNEETCAVGDFDLVYTDHGVCYAFNADPANPKYITETGSSNGLRLTLNVEQYEYMAGPNHAAGLKVLLLGQKEVAFVEDLGDCVPTGLDAFVSISKIKEIKLPEPHGDCELDLSYSQTLCFDTCRAKHALSRCGCVHFYMTSTHTGKNYNLQDCECPTACLETRYDSSINYASTPSGEGQMQVNWTDLSKRHLVAREAAQRVTKRIVKEDTDLVVSVLESFTHTEKATDKVLQMMTRFGEMKNRLWEEMSHRIWVHIAWGLEKVDFTIDNDFTRLWGVIDERTLFHVTTGFYQTTELFREMVNVTLYTPRDDTERAIWHDTTRRELLLRQFLVERALGNLTVINEAFTHGELSFCYKKSPKRRYDKIWIPLEIFQESKSARNLMTKWSKYLNVIRDQIIRMLRFNDQLFFNSTVNMDDMNNALLTFEHRCRSHNYYRYLYHYKIVRAAKVLVTDRLKEFQDLSDDFEAVSDSFSMLVDNIAEKIMTFKRHSGQRLSEAIHQAITYLKDKSFQKVKVAEFVNNEDIWFDLNAIANLFKDIRSRSMLINDDWRRFGNKMLDIMKNMLNETWTKPFYQRVHDEMDEPLSQDLLSIWQEMLDRPLDNLTSAEMKPLLNADFPDIIEEDYIAKKSSELGNIMHENGISQLTGDHADHFVNAFETLQTVLKSYMKSTDLDSKFFSENFLRLNVYVKSLSYEYYEHQEAYDVVALLSDIGGTLSLYIGASVITLCEIMDAIIINLLKIYRK